MLDMGKIGKLTAEFMEIVENGAPEGATIGEAVIVAEVRWTDEDGKERMAVTTGSTTDNRIHQSGIVDHGYNLILNDGDPYDTGDDDA